MPPHGQQMSIFDFFEETDPVPPKQDIAYSPSPQRKVLSPSDGISPTLGSHSALADLNALAGEIRDLHQKNETRDYCIECQHPWPCSTSRAVARYTVVSRTR